MKCPYECNDKTPDGFCKRHGCKNNKYNPFSYKYSEVYVSSLHRKHNYMKKEEQGGK